MGDKRRPRRSIHEKVPVSPDSRSTCSLFNQLARRWPLRSTRRSPAAEPHAMDHIDQAAEAAVLVSTEARRRGMAAILEAAASRAALTALDRALALAAAGGGKRGIALQGQSLAQSSLRAAELMQEHLTVAQSLQR